MMIHNAHDDKAIGFKLPPNQMKSSNSNDYVCKVELCGIVVL